MQFEARFLTTSEVCQYLGITRSTIYRQIKKGGFPKQVKIGKLNKWERSAVDNWIEQQKTTHEGE